MNFEEYKKVNRGKKVPAEINERWNARIVQRSLHLMGEDGAAQYLSDYGKSIAAPKCILLALKSEEEGYPKMADGFWAKAYELEYMATPIRTVSDVGNLQVKQVTEAKPVIVSKLPVHLQPGKIVTMQPTDALHDREYYILDPNYIGMPKRDGNKIVIINEDRMIYYQSRAGNLQSPPDREIDHILKLADNKFLNYIIEGEKVYYDWDGREHRTGAQAAKINVRAGHPEIQPRVCICIFDCLMTMSKSITHLSKQTRYEKAREIVDFLQSNNHNDDNFELVPYITSEAEKRKLCERQVAEGREGEIWAMRISNYVGGKDKSSEAIVRTKYLKKIICKIIGLTPTTAQGRPFGAIEISLNGISVGSVGTGYTVSKMWEINELFHGQGREVMIEVATQGFTEDDQVMHGRFRNIVN